MPTFSNGDVEIAYLDEGAGEPIVLVHGFASNTQVNWVQPGWVSTLTRDNRRVIALDNRGHGQSTKLYDPADYHTDLMAGDVAALIAHLGLERADVMGYSLGARITAVLAARHPERVRSVILGGVGIKLVEVAGLHHDVARSLELPSIDDVTDPQGKAFRLFAEQTQSDLRALAACLRGSRQTLQRDELARRAGAGAGRGRHQGRHRRIAGRTRGAVSATGRRSTSRTATTWSRSATACSRRPCSNS